MIGGGEVISELEISRRMGFALGWDGGEGVFGFREVSRGFRLRIIWLLLWSCVTYMKVEGASAVVHGVAFPTVAASWGLFECFSAVSSGVV